MMKKLKTTFDQRFVCYVGPYLNNVINQYIYILIIYEASSYKISEKTNFSIRIFFLIS